MHKTWNWKCFIIDVNTRMNTVRTVNYYTNDDEIKRYLILASDGFASRNIWDRFIHYLSSFYFRTFSFDYLLSEMAALICLHILIIQIHPGVQTQIVSLSLCWVTATLCFLVAFSKSPQTYLLSKSLSVVLMLFFGNNWWH